MSTPATPVHDRARAWGRACFGPRADALPPDDLARAYQETRRVRGVVFAWAGGTATMPRQRLHTYAPRVWREFSPVSTVDVFSPEDPLDPRLAKWIASARRVAPRAIVEGERLPEVQRILDNWTGRVSHRVAFPLLAYRIAEVCIERYTWNGDAPASTERSGAVTLEARSRRLSATFTLDGEVLLRARGSLA